MNHTHYFHTALVNVDVWSELTKYMWPDKYVATFGEYSDPDAAIVQGYESIIINKGIINLHNDPIRKSFPWMRVYSYKENVSICLENYSVTGMYPLDLKFPHHMEMAYWYARTRIIRWLLKHPDFRPNMLPNVDWLNYVFNFPDQELARTIISSSVPASYMTASCEAAEVRNFELARWLWDEGFAREEKWKHDDEKALGHVIDKFVVSDEVEMLSSLFEIYPIGCVISGIRRWITSCLRVTSRGNAIMKSVVWIRNWITTNKTKIISSKNKYEPIVNSIIEDLRKKTEQFAKCGMMLDELRTLPKNKLMKFISEQLSQKYLAQKLDSADYIVTTQSIPRIKTATCSKLVYNIIDIHSNSPAHIIRHSTIIDILEWLDAFSSNNKPQTYTSKIFTYGALLYAAECGQLDLVQHCYQKILLSSTLDCDTSHILFDALAVTIASEHKSPLTQIRMVKWLIETSLAECVIDEEKLLELHKMTVKHSPLLVIRYVYTVLCDVYGARKSSIPTDVVIRRTADILEWSIRIDSDALQTIIEHSSNKLLLLYPRKPYYGSKGLAILNYLQWFEKINPQSSIQWDYNISPSIMSRCPQLRNWIFTRLSSDMDEFHETIEKLMMVQDIKNLQKLMSFHVITPYNFADHNNLERLPFANELKHLHSDSVKKIKTYANMKRVYQLLNKRCRQDLIRLIINDRIDNDIDKARILSWIYYKHREDWEGSIKFEPINVPKLTD